MEPVLKSFPEMFRVFVTKHVSHFCGTNKQLSRIDDGTTKNVCPSCGCPDKTPSHITKCLDPGRLQMFTRSVDQLTTWLQDQNTREELTVMIRQYLLGRGKTLMTSLVSRGSPYSLLAKYHDRLGWDNFVEGRICKIWLQAHNDDIEEKNLKTTPDFWARGLMRWLLQLTHRQWLQRNMVVHYKVEDLTQVQYESVMSRIEDMIYMDTMDLLPEYISLLEVDFDKLVDSPAEDK
jgi:hypothetical protein